MRETHIYALGDSITYGFPYGPAHSWVKMVAERLSVPIINGGVNGDTIEFMLHRLQRALAVKPSHLILLGGTNDAYWGHSVSDIGATVTKICNRCRDAGIHVILGLPIPVDEHNIESILAEYRTFISDTAKREGYSLIPFHNAFLGKDNRFKIEFTTDGCHPNIDGYEAMAEVAEHYLAKILEV
jgi:lysophospholipase L1-like esterase